MRWRSVVATAAVVAVATAALGTLVWWLDEDGEPVVEQEHDEVASTRISVRGPDLVGPDGEPFLFLGSTLYALPFYEGGRDGTDPALNAETRRNTENLGPILDRMRAEGLNSVRIPLSSAGWESDAYAITSDEWLTRLELIASEARQRDLQVVISWWDAAMQGDEWPERYREAFPMMRAVHERLADYENVVAEPWNEPNDVSWDEWYAVTADTIRFWRSELGYDGLLVMNTTDYSWSFDPNEADRVIAFDAALRGEPNVAFANHRYANANDCFCGEEREDWEEEVGRFVPDYPLIVTEIGNFNRDWEPSDVWVDQFARHLVEDRVPAGLDGIFVFTWRWVDPNTMTEPDGVTLTSFGQRMLDQLEATAPDGMAAP